MPLEQILHSDRGAIVAPAGCGKTHLIANALSHQAHKPYLVLTHTTAGVAALKKRLHGVPTNNYRVATIAGWALNIARMFPSITGYVSPPNMPPDYNSLQQAVGTLCARGNLNDVLRATYSRVFVDEYQDCNISQHRIVCGLAQCLPTIVFGDPMQSIFNFAGPLPDWDESVLGFFPQLAELNIPWRWNNSGTPALGEWILSVRQQLSVGNQIDLASGQPNVTWWTLGSDLRQNRQNQINAHYQILQGADDNDRVLVIGDSRNVASRHEFARSVNGLGVVEPVDLRDVVAAARDFDGLEEEALLNSILQTVTTMMAGVNRTTLLTRAKTIANCRNRTAPLPHEVAAAGIIRDSKPESIMKLLTALEENDETRLFRRDAFFALKDSLALAITDQTKSLYESAAIVREQRRRRGDKRIPSRAIGSTLLLKGLEAEHVLILNAGDMNNRHLYVALSRGAKSVTVFSYQQYVG